MALTLPYPDMNFVPLDVLTAAEQNQLVANIEYIANNVEESSTIYTLVRTKIYIDGTSGDDTNTGLSTASPKKTLAGVMAKVNELGGSADIRFLSAGTYTLAGSYFDGANFIFEKNSSSIGDITINATGTVLFENSSVVLTGVDTDGSTMQFYNSYFSTSTGFKNSNVLEFNGSSAIIYSPTIKNRLVCYSGSNLYLTSPIIDLIPTVSGNNIISLNHGSKLGIATSMTIQPMPEGSALNLIYGTTGADVALTPTIIDNTGTSKLKRGLYLERAVIRTSSSAITTLNGMGTSSNNIAGTLQIVGNATVGA